MNYMEREKSDGDGMAKLVLRHASIVRQYIWLIVGMALAGLLAGALIQWSATDTYTKEVLLKSSNGLHLSVVANMIQPTSVLFDNRNKIAQFLPRNTTSPEEDSKDAGKLTFENNWANLILLGEAPPEFQALNLQIVLRAANSNMARISAINSLPKDSRLARLASQGDDGMDKVIRKFRISNFNQGSDEIVISFDGKSIAETETAIEAIITTLRNQFIALERDRIKSATKTKLLVLDSQIRGRENVVRRTVNPAGANNRENDITRALQSDVLLIALKSDQEEIESYAFDKLDIELFAVVPIELSKKTSVVDSNLWLLMTTLAGLLLGLVAGYILYGIRRLKNI